MEKRFGPAVALIAGILLLLPGGTAGVIPCVSVRVKAIQLHHVCGTVTNSAGEPVAKASVTILQSGKELRTIQTNADGKFSFEKFSAGHYKIRVEAEGYARAQSSILVFKPSSSCRRTLQVSLAETGKCSSVSRAER